MLDVNSKILWFADYNLDEAPGGAQRSDQMIIEQGKLLGYHIYKKTVRNYDDDIDFENFDVVVSSNICALTLRDKDLINKISRHKYHVRLEHDSNEYLNREDRQKLFASCRRTIFLTNFHHEFFKQFYGDIFKNIEIIYDPIDKNLFKDYNEAREDKILYAGYLHPLKGAYEFLEFVLQNPSSKFVVAGWPSTLCIDYLCKTIPNIEYLGLQKYEDMPRIYNKYKTMFYNPNLNEPFCRSVAEAILCGMSILSSKQNQIGCLYELRKEGIENFRTKCSKASIDFWNKI